jgi:hypothetical protein
MFPIPRLWLIVCAGMLAGCGTMANGLEWGQDATLAPGWGRGDVKRRFTCTPREEETKFFRIKFPMTVTNQEINAKAFSPLDDSLLFTFPFHVC